MKKIAIAVVALPLTCMGAGYAAGLALIPPVPATAETPAVDDSAVTDHPAATDAAGHDAPDGAHADPHADAAPEALNAYTLAEDRTVIRLGQMTIPVEKLHSVSYVVADFALKTQTMEVAERYKRVEEATRLRDALLTAMNVAAESAVLRGVSIDSDALSDMILGLMQKQYPEIEDVLFVSLYKQDVARL